MDSERKDPTPSHSQTPDPPVDGEEPVITSGSLFGPHREVLIRHADEIYRLRITRTGKLILTK
jgi:hemin uptake protein HemP